MELYRDYICKVDTPVSYWWYCRTIKEKNISFAKLGSEQCEKVCDSCNSYEGETYWVRMYAMFSIWTSPRICEESERTVPGRWENLAMLSIKYLLQFIRSPKSRYASANWRYKICSFYTKNNCFQLIPGPLQKGKATGFIWHQGIFGRNHEELSSVMFQVLRHYNKGLPHMVIWVDNCTGQNKNWTLYNIGCVHGGSSCAVF